LKRQYFWWIVSVYVLAIFYISTTTPITPHEAKLLFASNGIVNYFMLLGQNIFSGFIGFRIFFIFFGFLSIILFYNLSKRYFLNQNDVYTSTTIFMLLPGIITGSVMSNIAIIVLPLVLLFVLLYEKEYFIFLPFILLILFLIHDASIIFFIALFIYGLSHKDKKLFILSALFLIIFLIMQKGIDIGGRPSGHFIDIFGQYAALFSPLVFLYFFYTLYRILLREKKTLLWYISFTALAFSLLLSIRQRIHISDFAPYVTISIILMLDIFNNSLRVRLPQFKKRYKLGFNIIIFSLIISVIIIFLHQLIFYISSNQKKHFANRIYEPYNLSKKLKLEEIDCYDSKSSREQYQLMYYNIKSCNK